MPLFIKKSLIILQILSLFFIFSCSGSSSGEGEENGTFNNAKEVNSGNTITGTFKSRKDIDFYKIDFRGEEPDSYLKISLSGVKGISTKISVYNEKKRLITGADDFFVNQKEILVNFKPDKELYYIRISVERVKGNVKYPSSKYKLDFKTYTETGIESEPNNSFNTAQDITNQKKVKGYFSPFFSSNFNSTIKKSLTQYIEKTKTREININKISGYDIDIYKIRLQEQEKYNARFVLTTTENVNVVLILFDQVGNIIELRNNHGFGSGEGISNLTVSGGKTYYVAVLGYERTINFNPEKNAYTLEFTTNSFSHDQETEPNNNKKNATSIVSSVTKGYLNPVKDVDWYKLTITPVLMRAIDKNFTGYLNNKKATSVGQRPDLIMTVKLKAIPDIDLMMEIVDEKGTVQKKINSTGKGGDEIMLNYNVSFGKSYYLVIKGSSANSKESFKKQYELKVSFRDKMQNEEAEPNDAKTMKVNPSNQVKVGGGINGYMSPASDVDYIYVVINFPGKYEIKITGVPGIKFRVELYDPEDFAVGINTSKKAGMPVTLRRIISSTGIHHIVIRNMSKKRTFNNKTRYFLTIKNIKNK